MLLIFIYPHDDIFAAVKQESSLHSIRQRDKEGGSMFESLVFDEAYLVKFRELFFNAQAQIIPVIAAYKKGGAESEYFERRAFTKNRDFICHLLMPDDFNERMSRPLEDAIFNFLKDWIMYKWLETKLPETAAVFAANCEGYKGDVRRALNSRSGAVRRQHSLY